MLTIFIQTYFRMHHFVVKFSIFFRLRRQGGIDPPNQNPADPLAIRNVLGDDWLCTGDWSACPYKDVVAT